LRIDQITSEFIEIIQNKKEHQLYKRDPLNKEEYIKKDFHIFLCLKELFWKLNNRSLEPVHALLDKMFYKTPNYIAGTEIRLENKQLIRCNIFVQKDNKTVPVPRYLFYDDGFLFIIELNPIKQHFAKIKAAIPLLNTKTQTSKEYMYTLRLICEKLKSDYTKNKIFECILVLENYEMCKEVKSIIQKFIAVVNQNTHTYIFDLLNFQLN
jgi:hypothetical protein